MKIEIKKGKAAGIFIAPPSKSAAHRALICAALSHSGESIINNIAQSNDILASADCLRALGAEITFKDAYVKVIGASGSEFSSERILNCRESGSTLRFILPLCLDGGVHVLYGSERLMQRPLGVYEEIFKKQNILFERQKSSVKICGKLSAGEFMIPGNISSQFISGLAFALPNLKKDSVIKIIPPVESSSYIDMTINCLMHFGVNIIKTDKNILYISGNQNYKSTTMTVEGDYSNAAFFEALNYAGGDVKITGLDEDSVQGDKVYKKYFDSLAMQNNIPLDISNCPDLAPVLMSVAAIYGGGHFTGTSRLKIKESDRGNAMAEELEKCGINCIINENEIAVKGTLRAPRKMLYGHNDHRIVMALSLLLTMTGGRIDGAEAVRKSFPNYFEKLALLGIEVNEIDS